MSGTAANAPRPGPRRYTLLLKLSDRPGGMELVAATFAHRGLSLTLSLGTDGTLDPDGYATVVVHFEATPARKEAVKAALSRLSPVVSLVEYDAQDPRMLYCALVRLAPGAPVPTLTGGGKERVDVISEDAQTGETVYSLFGPPNTVRAALKAMGKAGHLRAVTHTILAV